MRKIIIVIVFVAAYILGNAQEKATPVQIGGVYVVAMATLNEGYHSTESIRVPNEVLRQSESLDDRIQWIIQQTDVVGLLVTRDGINFQLVREWNKNDSDIVTTSLFSKPVFCYAEPLKKYRVIKEQRITTSFSSMSFVEVAKQYIDLPGLTYDAVIIKNGTVKYIRF